MTRKDTKIIEMTCDRCGKMETKKTHGFLLRFKRFQWFWAFIGVWDPYSLEITYKREYDFCDDCYDSLKNWLGNHAQPVPVQKSEDSGSEKRGD